MFDCLKSVCPCFFTKSEKSGPNVDSDQNLNLGQRIYNVFYNIMSSIFRWPVARPNGNGSIEPVNENLGAQNRAVPHNPGLSPASKVSSVLKSPNSPIRSSNLKGKEELKEASHEPFQSINWSAPFQGLWNGRKLEGDGIVYDGNKPLVIDETLLREIRGTNGFLNSLFQVFWAMGPDFCQKLCQKHPFFRPYFEQYANEQRQGALTLNGLRAGAEGLGLKLEQESYDPADVLGCLGKLDGEIGEAVLCTVPSDKKNVSILDLLGRGHTPSDSKFQVFQIDYLEVDRELISPEMGGLFKCQSPLFIGEDLLLSGCQYRLKAFIRYVDDVGGHYRAYVSRLNPQTQDTEYFYCDDEEIALISEAEFNTHVNFAHLIFFEKQN